MSGDNVIDGQQKRRRGRPKKSDDEKAQGTSVTLAPDIDKMARQMMTEEAVHTFSAFVELAIKEKWERRVAFCADVDARRVTAEYKDAIANLGDLYARLMHGHCFAVDNQKKQADKVTARYDVPQGIVIADAMEIARERVGIYDAEKRASLERHSRLARVGIYIQ